MPGSTECLPGIGHFWLALSLRLPKFWAMAPGLRERLLQEWRLLPEKKAGRDAQPVGLLLEKQLDALGLKDRLIEDQLVEAWAEAVGRPNADFSKPVQLRRGQLVVAVAQPALLYELERFHKAEILRRLQERFGSGTIREIRFRVGS